MSLKSFTFSLILINLLSVISPLYSQGSTNFFPHHVGDMWEYYFTEFVGSDILQVFVIKDSIDQEGNHHVIQTARSINPVAPPSVFFWDTTEYIIDTLNQVSTYLSFGSGPLVTYKLDAQQGDQWVLWGYPGYYEMARVINVREDTLFGVPTVVKGFSYYLAADSTDTTGLVWLYDELSDGFGLTYRFGPEIGLYAWLKGAIIDGILYGDTTLVGINLPSSSQIPYQINLFQNYPNPFNPQTTIPLQLKKSGRLSLLIYDVTGRTVRKLIDNEWYMAGKHAIEWNGKTQRGSDAASGIYFYQLITGQQRLNRRMLLIR